MQLDELAHVLMAGPPAETTLSGDAEIIEISEGVKVIHRRNPDVELFTLTAATEGGLRAETLATAGLLTAPAAS